MRPTMTGQRASHGAGQADERLVLGLILGAHRAQRCRRARARRAGPGTMHLALDERRERRKRRGERRRPISRAEPRGVTARSDRDAPVEVFVAAHHRLDAVVLEHRAPRRLAAAPRLVRTAERVGQRAGERFGRLRAARSTRCARLQALRGCAADGGRDRRASARPSPRAARWGCPLTGRQDEHVERGQQPVDVGTLPEESHAIGEAECVGARLEVPALRSVADQYDPRIEPLRADLRGARRAACRSPCARRGSPRCRRRRDRR